MKQPPYAPILDSLARDHVPDDVDLLPRIMARVAPKGPLPVKPKHTLAWTVLLVVLSLGLVTTVAYALYHVLVDPGLQSVQDSGLVTHLDTTAEPTILPTLVEPTLTPHPATPLSLSQSQAGVTLRLEWIYLEEMHLAVGLDVEGLAGGMTFGSPAINFGAVDAEQFRGANLLLRPSGTGFQGMLVSNQLARPLASGGTLDLNLDLPLIQGQADQESTLATFHFNVQGVPVASGNSLAVGTSYAVRVAGQVLQLDFLFSSPLGGSADLCQPSEQVASGYQVPAATLRWGQAGAQPGQVGLDVQTALTYTTADGRACQRLYFPGGALDAVSSANLQVDELAAGEQRLAGPWAFTVGFPARSAVPGLEASSPTPEPTRVSQTIGDLTATLQWAYADAQRVALHITFSRWQADWMVNQVLASDPHGDPLGWWGSARTVSGDPADVIILLTPNGDSPLEGDRVQLAVDVPISTQSAPQTQLAAFHFDLDLPVYAAVVSEPGLQVTANGLTMTLARVQMTPSYSLVTLCYDKPTRGANSDWGVGDDVRLRVDGVEASMEGYRLLKDDDYQLKKSSVNDALLPAETDLARCVAVEFPLGHHASTTSVDVWLEVPSLEKSPPEVISDADVARANQVLAAQGIEVNYAVLSGDGGGGATFNVLQKPEGLSDAEVIQRFYEALGYSYGGPWTFELSVQP